MEKDYSLLRPFNLEAAKRGEKVCWYKGDDMPPKTFFITPQGNCVSSFSGEPEAFWQPHELEMYFRIAPLAWVEGKPVYKGDVLWHCTGIKLVAHKPRRDAIDGFIAEDGDYGCSEFLTWQKPKTKRVAWVNVYKDGFAYYYDTKGAANDAADENTRIACCRIEWEE